MTRTRRNSQNGSYGLSVNIDSDASVFVEKGAASVHTCLRKQKSLLPPESPDLNTSFWKEMTAVNRISDVQQTRYTNVFVIPIMPEGDAEQAHSILCLTSCLRKHVHQTDPLLQLLLLHVMC